MSRSNRAKLNVVLLLLVMLGFGYIALWPLYPAIALYWQGEIKAQTIPAEEISFGLVENRFALAEPEALYQNDTLVIPKIGVEAIIFSGDDARVLRDGVWHRPGSGNPIMGGNFVLAGHRFLYTSGRNTLYFLDRLEKGDLIVVFWKKKRYLYEVEGKLEVLADGVEIEQPTTQSLLTIYTCTPLYTNLRRLVVRARPVDGGVYELKN